jgi:hypothetical protein
MDAESTVSLIMGASAVDLCEGEHHCVEKRADTFRTWTVLVEAAESKQATQRDKLDSARARFHARVSTTEQTASGIQK